MSASASHQTVRIARGAHASPADGACVVELASMLAGERFSDRPKCVCPALAAYLRAYNDRVGYARRQELLPYASRAVGTRHGRALTRRRRDLCLQAAGFELTGRGAVTRAGARLRARARIAVLMGVGPAVVLHEGAAIYAARRAVAAGDTAGALELLEALLREGATGPPDPDQNPRRSRALLYSSRSAGSPPRSRSSFVTRSVRTVKRIASAAMTAVRPPT